MSELLLSIDLGTTRLKAAAYASDGTLAHLVNRRHDESGAGDFRWQSAEGWWASAVSAVRELVEALPGDEIVGIGLSGRGGAAVFADENGGVVADPWSDGRHHREAKALRDWRRQQDVWLSNYGLQMIAKYQWLHRNEPGSAERIRYGFFAKDWLLFQLTGAHMTDWTSGPDAPEWDDHLSELVPANLLPAPALPWTLAGTLTTAAANALALPADTPVCIGAHDGLAANIGAGAVADRSCAITLGTHAVVRMALNEKPADAYRFYGCPPDKHIIGGNAVLAGRSVDWFVELTGAGSEKADGYDQFEAAASEIAAGADGVRFLPFLAGQVAPESRPGARGLFAGLNLEHTRAHLYRGLLEGGAFAVAEIFDQVTGWCGQPSLIRATGGGSESALWMEILASILGAPIELSGAGVEGRGAAVCLAVALGRYPDTHSAIEAMVRVEQTAMPDPVLMDRYKTIRADWQALNALSRGYNPG